MSHWIQTFDSDSVTQDEVMASLHKPRHLRTKRDVMILKTKGCVYGCCNDFADYSPCDCLENAVDDTPAVDPKSGNPIPPNDAGGAA